MTNPVEIKIRTATADDVDSIQHVFRRSILETCGNDYSAQQLQCWAKAFDDTRRILEKLLRDYFVIIFVNEECAGFASLQDDQVDLLYVNPAYQREGLARKLYEKLEERAQLKELTMIRANSSVSAIPFFKRMGFQPVSLNTVIVKGISMPNWTMQKDLHRSNNF